MRLDAIFRPRVATRIRVGFGVVLVLLASLGALLYVAIASFRTAMDAESKLGRSAVEILDVKGQFSEMRRAVDAFTQSGKDDSLNAALASEEATYQKFEEAISHSSNAETIASLNEALALFKEYGKRVASITSLRKELDRALTQRMNPTAERLVSAVHRIIRIADSRDDYDMVSLASSAQNHLQTARLGVASFQLTLETSLAGEVKQKLTAFKAALNSLKFGMKTDKEKALLQELIDDVSQYESAFGMVQQAALGTKALSEEATAKFADVLTMKLEDIKGRQWKIINDKRADLEQLLKQIMYVLGGAILAALGIGTVVSLLITRSIVKPIYGMTSAMSSLASGDLEVQIPALDRTDEMGEMGKAVAVFRDAAQENRRLERAAEDARVQAEHERVQAQADAIASERALVSGSIGAGLSRLAAKDLTVRLDDSLPEAYARLRDDFNLAMTEIEAALKAVGTSGHTIAGSTREISTSADDLSRRTEQQAASLEQTAAALDQITATGKKAAQGAQHARDVVTIAKSDAEKTGLVVRKTVEAMSDIEKSAQQISQIIGVIDEIAFQTNLLALNAGVEAARAGDAGRGFAVVASEVRALAQRSAEAAKEIKGLISTSSSQVAEGVGLVAETGKALERILVQVNDINSVVVDIAAGAHEQATGLSEVNSAINQMDQTTQQNAAMVEETTAASHTLAQETAQLNALIAEFRLSGTDADDAHVHANHSRVRAA